MKYHPCDPIQYTDLADEETTARELKEAEKRGAPDSRLMRMRRDLRMKRDGEYITHAGCSGKTYVEGSETTVYCVKCGDLM